MSLIFGVDPSSDGFPMAKYRDGKLINLVAWPLFDFIEVFHYEITRPDLLVIEDVMSQTFRYSRTDARFRGKSQQQAIAISFKMGQGLGKCMAGQKAAMDMAEHYGVPVIAVKPTAGNWADDKARFEAATGWTKQSNRDTRSAAYFGWLHRHYRIKT